jgi:hypothetical protein
MLHRVSLLVAIMVTAGLAAGVGAAGAALPCGTDCPPSLFAPLRQDIGAFTPAASARSFLAKVDVAEMLLFPPSGHHPPSPCTSANVLNALAHEVQAQSRFSPIAAATIQTDITDLLGLPVYHPPSPCRFELQPNS